MQKALLINPEKCTGCLQCEMACSFENYGTFATARSRIKVFDFHETGRKVPYTCTQCDEAWCQHACPVEAITVDANTGATLRSYNDTWTQSATVGSGAGVLGDHLEQSAQQARQARQRRTMCQGRRAV